MKNNVQIIVSIVLVTLTLCSCVPGQQSIIRKEQEGLESTAPATQTGTENESTSTEATPVQVTKDTSSIIEDVAPSVVLIMNRKYYPLSYGEKNYDLFPFRYKDNLGKYPAWTIGAGVL